MRILSTALVLAVASLAVPAAAGEASKGRASVSYSDLDLDTEAGRVELGKRFEQAARDMCGVTSDAPRGSKRYCYERASKQLALRAAAIVEAHQAAGG